jgi:hypothetical protein
MLANAILGIRRKKGLDDKPTANLVGVELLIAIVGIVSSFYSCYRVIGTTAHRHLVFLGICYASIFVPMISFKYPYPQANFLYFWVFNFIACNRHGAYDCCAIFRLHF